MFWASIVSGSVTREKDERYSLRQTSLFIPCHKNTANQITRKAFSTSAKFVTNFLKNGGVAPLSKLFAIPKL